MVLKNGWKIYDCFPFFNELDLLEIRLNHLWDHVDYFVLVEADRTHRGKPKEFRFESNKERFLWASSKIIYIKIKLDISGRVFNSAGSYSPQDDIWRNENDQRNAILEGISSAKSEDIIMISDLDEIPSVYALQLLPKLMKISPFFCLMQKLYYHYLDLRRDDHLSLWPGTSVVLRRVLDKPQEIRNRRHTFPYLKKYAGHHFSSLGGIDSIIEKIESFAHSEYDKERYKNEDYIRECILSGRSIFRGEEGRLYGLYDVASDPSYPRFILEKRDQYQHLFFSNEKVVHNNTLSDVLVPDLEQRLDRDLLGDSLQHAITRKWRAVMRRFHLG